MTGDDGVERDTAINEAVDMLGEMRTCTRHDFFFLIVAIARTRARTHTNIRACAHTLVFLFLFVLLSYVPTIDKRVSGFISLPRFYYKYSE